ncbi:MULTISPECIES: DUF3211 domain-containing protein [Metallosphaera]|uniref:DUF3211 domain-containing protein n=1 Tax=Metallosphaera TaxID=41980 RepID=UPI001F06CBB1|nr:DUF3211 domain-containing protein [Metallosphaera sedula]MCH1771929.1 DUF3211 domain-containing protein [Metallosphaera sedula]MCP6728549.1 DUF3211 domain-containing protein [Metallosphaera sedula]
MILELSVGTSHDVESLRIILSDPYFVLPTIFPSIKGLKILGGSFQGYANYLGIEHQVSGNIYISKNEVTYPFTLSKGKNLGAGKLTFYLIPGRVLIRLEYEGWMERLAGGLLRGWVKKFSNDLEEKVRMERIKRKI